MNNVIGALLFIIVVALVIFIALVKFNIVGQTLLCPKCPACPTLTGSEGKCPDIIGIPYKPSKDSDLNGYAEIANIFIKSKLPVTCAKIPSELPIKQGDTCSNLFANIETSLKLNFLEKGYIEANQDYKNLQSNVANNICIGGTINGQIKDVVGVQAYYKNVRGMFC